MQKSGQFVSSRTSILLRGLGGKVSSSSRSLVSHTPSFPAQPAATKLLLCHLTTQKSHHPLISVSISGHGRHASSSSPRSWEDNSTSSEVETQGQPEHRFTSSERRGISSALHDAEEDPSTAHHRDADNNKDSHVDVYNHSPSVNLSSCMQSQVPEPYGKTPGHMNMPGGVSRREDKYIQGRLHDMKGTRTLHTNARLYTSTSTTGNTTSGSTTAAPVSSEDEHGNPTYATASRLQKVLDSPCPQGVQGDDCATFKLWLTNCLVHGKPQDCEKLANEYIAGRKTLGQVFAEYDMQIRSVQKRKFSTSARNSKDEVGGSPEHAKADAENTEQPLTRAAKLKRAVKDYGSTVIVFHVGISLISLGGFYLLVSSNVDIDAFLKLLPGSVGEATQKTVHTASTFAAAYAVHKIFAPVRIGITLTCAPVIVRSLRAKGILKSPKI